MSKPQAASTFINNILLYRTRDDKIMASCDVSIMDANGVLIEESKFIIEEGQGLNSDLARRLAKALHRNAVEHLVNKSEKIDMSVIRSSLEIKRGCCK